MDWFIGLFLAFSLLFFWGVWIFGYWLPMAKEAQRQFREQEEKERRAKAAGASRAATAQETSGSLPAHSHDG